MDHILEFSFANTCWHKATALNLTEMQAHMPLINFGLSKTPDFSLVIDGHRIATVSEPADEHWGYCLHQHH